MGHKVGRNDSCPCGSGKKYKKCCMDKVTIPKSFSWNIDRVGAMSTEEIFEKLSTMGIQTDQDQFLRDVHQFYSASALANHWLEPTGSDISGVDFVHYAAVSLWERLAPDVINDETIDYLMQEGYEELERRKLQIACHLWLTAWGYLKTRFTSGMKSIQDAEIVFSGSQNLYNWTQDLEMELGNAELHQDRITYCREFCDFFPDSPDPLLLNMKLAEAEGYFNIGESEKAESLFSELQRQYPDNVWVYCRWGDLFLFSRLPDFVPDFEKAEMIYRMALGRNLEGEGDVMERIRDMKKMQKKEKR